MKTIIKRGDVILFEMIKDNKTLSESERIEIMKFDDDYIDSFTIEFTGGAKVKDIDRLDKITLDKILSMTINLRKEL